jgi:L-malate glycosyltransferase
MRKALIIQETIKHYRVPFYERLRTRLSAHGVQLLVAYSDPTAREASKGDNVELPKSFGLKVPAYRLVRGRVLYQPLLAAVADADLVVVEQANRHLLNHCLLMLAAFNLKRVAFWGHGWNRQAAANSATERYKALTLGLAYWWFAYTAGTADYLQTRGYDARRITTVQNAVDTAAFRALVRSVSDAEKTDFRQQLGIAADARVGLYCGSLYPAKHIGFLLESARVVRSSRPDFELLVMGGGPDHRLVQQAVRDCPWVHCLGPTFGHEKAVAFSVAELCLNPGLIGLGLLDAFAAALPVFTTDLPIHSPEIEYLEDASNGRITPFETSAYAAAIAAALAAPSELSRLRRGAEDSGGRYTLEAMVHNFQSGIVRCLAS